MATVDKLNSEFRQMLMQAFQLTQKYPSDQLQVEHVAFTILNTHSLHFIKNKEDVLATLVEKMTELKSKATKEKAEVISSSLNAVLDASIASAKDTFNKDVVSPEIFMFVLSKTVDYLKIKINEKEAIAHINAETTAKLSFLTNINDYVEKEDILIIGGEENIREVSRIIQRKSKNCPLLIGKPGVGKTSIIYSLASRINKRNVSESLENKTIYLLNTSDILINSKDRVELHTKVKDLIAFLKENQNIILVIDEIHSLFQGEGIYLLNLIKQCINDQKLITIGLTTQDKYNTLIKEDSSLERIFRSVIIEEASKEETLTILRGIQVKYEKYHDLKITDDALKSIVDLSARLLSAQTFPDKAIDILDEACALVKMKLNSKPEALETLQAELMAIQLELLSAENNSTELMDKKTKLEQDIEQINTEWLKEKALYFGVHTLKEKIAQTQTQIKDAMSKEDFETAMKLQGSVLPELQKELMIAEDSLRDIKEDEKTLIFLKNEVDTSDIAEIVSKRTGVPVSKLQTAETEKLLNMASILKKKIINQDEAVDKITEAIQMSKAGVADEDKPLGSFMFLGSSGTGKTELAKVLNQFLFDTPDSLIRFDMSEYMEKHSVAKLLGAPPGYAGYDEGGLLTEQVSKKPYSILLFDEIEKAHKDIFNILLSMLDEGFVTDSKGNKVDFRNTVIILTTNLGSNHIIDWINDPTSCTKEQATEQVLDVVKGYFRPELLNRFDGLLVFNALNEDAIKKIAELQLSKLQKRIKKNHDVELLIDDSIKDFIVKKGFDPVYGARPLKRAINNYLANKIATAVLSNIFKDKETVIMKLVNDVVTFE